MVASPKNSSDHNLAVSFSSDGRFKVFELKLNRSYLHGILRAYGIRKGTAKANSMGETRRIHIHALAVRAISRNTAEPYALYMMFDPVQNSRRTK